MGDYPISQRDFSGRLYVGGERDSMPRNAMRRCIGCSAEPEVVVRSRWGSVTRWGHTNILAITRFVDTHYLSDGHTLFKENSEVAVQFNGGRPTFVEAPPAIGLQPYLFMCGGGRNIKINQLGAITNWGIAPPSSAPTLTLGPQDSIVIDPFNSNPAGSWVPVGATVANETASLKISPTGGPWSVIKTFSTPQNYSVYSNGDISLGSDLIQITINFENPSDIVWVQLAFDVNIGDFSADYYTATFNVVGPTSDQNVISPVITTIAAPFQWLPYALAKSQFTRVGTDASKDWSSVKAIRFQGGNLVTNAPPVHITNLQQYGGFAPGAGPAALPGGGGVKRSYLVTFGNSVTGNDSNPCDVPATISGIKLQPVLLSSIPTSSDIQVGNRKIWMSENDGPFALLDTINDNASINDTDRTSSSPAPIINTPWQPSVSVAVGYYVDGGNGYYFRATVAGNTGSNVPTWNVPTAAWTVRGVFEVGDIILPDVAYRLQAVPNAFQCTQAGITGSVEPPWTAIGVGASVTDHTVVWTNIGELLTTDNTVTWLALGVNALPTPSNEVVQYDNTLFPPTINDAIFFGGSMFATRDTAQDSQTFVYISTPGKAEGYANIVSVGTNEEDLPQKLIVWDEQIYVMTTRYVYPLVGTPPNMGVGDLVVGAEGTSWPYTVVQTPYGIIYRATPGIKVFNNVYNEFLGYPAVAPLQTGRPVENLPLFTPDIAAHCRQEMIFADRLHSFAYSLESKTWRMLGTGATALYYHDEEDIIHLASSAKVVDWEVFGLLTDDGAPISIEWQSVSNFEDATQRSLSKRIYLDLNLDGQVLTPVLCVDENDVVLPQITNIVRSRIPIPWQVPGQIYGVRLTGKVVRQVTWYGVTAEMRNGR